MAAFGVKLVGEPMKRFAAAGKSVSDGMRPLLFKAATIAGGEIARTVTAVLGGKGRLANSFLPARFLRLRNGDIAAAAASDLAYAEKQDKGGVIRPKNRKNLAIPISHKAKRSGMWPRDWPTGALVLIRNKRKKTLLLVDAKKEDTVHYVLKPSVTLTGANYIPKARKSAAPKIRKVVGIDINANVLKGVRGG